MGKTLIQIYEVQNPAEAESLITLGVDHIGSVLLSCDYWKVETIRETVEAINRAGAKSGIIPLFGDASTIFQAIAYYRPDFIHFCDAIPIFAKDKAEAARESDAFITLQADLKKRFPQVKIMRSISVPQRGAAPEAGVSENILSFVKLLAPYCDYFLIDTIIGNHGESQKQPVAGFVGITGEVCNWDMAGRIIKQSPIPVILAGGISGENIFDAITKLRPAGVDSCTKTNAADKHGKPIRFQKDLAKVKHMVEEARRADAALAGALK